MQVLGIANRDKRNYKQGQLKGFQIGGKRLQIGAEISNQGKEISNWGRDDKSGQRLQIGAEHRANQLWQKVPMAIKDSSSLGICKAK